MGAKDSIFPDPEKADADGLTAIGGSLSPPILLDAYAHGIYPVFAPGETPLWWCPDPRCVLLPDNFHISARSRRKIAAQNFSITVNFAFSDVIRECGAQTRKDPGAWIGKDIISGYTFLHKLGLAYSVETWQDGELVGGLYGVVLKPIFFGESMFHRVTEASRAALCGLVDFLQWRGYTMIDCQQNSPHMRRMGAVLWPRHEFLEYLAAKLGPMSSVYARARQHFKAPYSPRFVYNCESGIWRRFFTPDAYPET